MKVRTEFDVHGGGCEPGIWRCCDRQIPLTSTRIMGIVNVTPDSFSDGGRWFDSDLAVGHGLQLVSEGADILDVGGESTRPGASEVSEAEEARRVLPVIRALAAHCRTPISIDTRRAAVARAALAAGACIVNDVVPFVSDAAMVDAVRETGAGVVLVQHLLMHQHGSGLLILQMHQNRRHDLRMLAAQQLGYRQRIHPLQAFNARDVT